MSWPLNKTFNVQHGIQKDNVGVTSKRKIAYANDSGVLKPQHLLQTTISSTSAGRPFKPPFSPQNLSKGRLESNVRLTVGAFCDGESPPGAKGT